MSQGPNCCFNLTACLQPANSALRSSAAKLTSYSPAVRSLLHAGRLLLTPAALAFTRATFSTLSSISSTPCPRRILVAASLLRKHQAFLVSADAWPVRQSSPFPGSIQLLRSLASSSDSNNSNSGSATRYDAYVPLTSTFTASYPDAYINGTNTGTDNSATDNDQPSTTTTTPTSTTATTIMRSQHQQLPYNMTNTPPVVPAVTWWPSRRNNNNNNMANNSSPIASATWAATRPEVAAELGCAADNADPFTMDLREVAAAAVAAAARGNAATSAGATATAVADDVIMTDAAGGGGGASATASATATAAATASASAGGGGGVRVEAGDPSVDVTRHNFAAMLPVVRRYLQSCDFFAFDCEMTGLFLEGQNENYMDDMQDRYTRTAAAAHSFIITQFGLSCFKRLPAPESGAAAAGAAASSPAAAAGGASAAAAASSPAAGSPASAAAAPSYQAATFNFYLFPRPPEGGSSSAASGASRRFMCDAGSLAFLASQGFDFNRCFYDGVPFMAVRQKDEMLRQLDRDNGGGGGGNSEGARGPDVALTKPEDVEFVQGLLGSVREWLSSDSPAPLDLPPVNRYLRLLAYQALARPESFGGPPGGSPDWHPGFYVRKSYDERNMTYLHLIRCASAAEAATLEAEDRAARRAEVAAAAGFAAVWEAMRDCGRPAVGHNCMFDVAYGTAQFGEGRLPATWQGFKSVVASWFRGGLYDTKHICRQLPGLLGSDTMLGTVFRSVVPQPTDAPPLASSPSPSASSSASPLPARLSVRHCRGFEKYVAVAAGQLAHEAGYDAFMTGCVFVALESLLAEDPNLIQIQKQSETAAAGAPAAATAASGTEASIPVATVASSSGGDGEKAKEPYAPVVPYVWRLNVTRSDLPYALLRPVVSGDPTSVEPVPERPLVFYLGGLLYGIRANDIYRRCEEAGLGKIRLTFLPGNNALVEVPTPEAAQAVAEGALRDRGLSNEVLTYAEYRARKDSMLAAGTWPIPGYGNASSAYGGQRGGGGGGGGVGNGGGGNGAGAGGNGAARMAKRPRVEGEAAAGGEERPPPATPPPDPMTLGLQQGTPLPSPLQQQQQPVEKEQQGATPGQTPRREDATPGKCVIM